jgi:hypothetical protein
MEPTSWAQSIELVPISGHQHQHRVGYINKSQHKPSVRVKTNNKKLKKLHTHEAQHLSMNYFTAVVVKMRVLPEQKSSLKRQILCMIQT